MPFRRYLPLLLIPFLLTCGTAKAGEREQRVKTLTQIPGLVAFWDFVQRENGGEDRFTAYVPEGDANTYPLDAGNYIKAFWDKGREATYADFPLMGRGPFGEAILIRRETDPDFRPYLYIPRERLHDSPLDIKGENKSVTVVVWAIRESGNHALAGIWHEGTDLKIGATQNIQKVEPGQRQYALFAGLNRRGSACAHVSENGTTSFLNKYALHKANSAGISPQVPSDAAPEILDDSWQCFAMSLDHEKKELTGWLNGDAGDVWLNNPQKNNLLGYAANAWLQGHLRREPGLQQGENPDFPAEQFYNPPEDEAVRIDILSETENERVELREYPYTKVKVTLTKAVDGTWEATGQELTALRLNPWWYPHGLYAPDAENGGPFTIGRVIHSGRSVGFTGWIGAVAVFDRALTAAELQMLTELGKKPVAAAPAR